MRTCVPILLAVVILLFANNALAQNVQMQCRPLVANDFVGQDEVIVEKQVCHVVHAAPVAQPVAVAPASTTVATVSTASTPEASAPVAAASAPASKTVSPFVTSGKATVILYRPSRFIDASRKATVYVDNRPLCILTNNTSLKFEMPAGQHALTTLNNRQTTGEAALPGSQFNFVAGQTYYFTLTKNWLIFAVSTQQGESESGRTKPLKDGNISVQPSGNELN
jgi:hypothetical protein